MLEPSDLRPLALEDLPSIDRILRECVAACSLCLQVHAASFAKGKLNKAELSVDLLQASEALQQLLRDLDAARQPDSPVVSPKKER